MIYHIISKEEWQEAKKQGEYLPLSLEKDGFIHCSDLDQVEGVANNLYEGEDDLLLLAIDENEVDPEIVYEDLYDLGEKFPHIYGPLNTETVTDAVEFSVPASGEGKFRIEEIEDKLED